MKTIPTRVAKHLLGDNLYFGHSTLHDLLGKESLTSLMSLAVTGRRCTSEERDLLDELAVIMCSADPRIWPLKLTRLVSSYGGTLAGYAAAQLPMEGEQIGPWIVGHAAEMLMRFKAALENQPNDEAGAAATFVKTTTRFLGYGVPLRPSDERLDALNLRMKATGRDQLPFWKLHERLAAEVLKQKNVIPNITVGFAAMLLDMGYTPHQAGAMTTFQNQNVFAANAYEAATQSEEVMRRLPDRAIDYVGQAPRVSPRALAHADASMKSGNAANHAVSRA